MKSTLSAAERLHQPGSFSYRLTYSRMSSGCCRCHVLGLHPLAVGVTQLSPIANTVTITVLVTQTCRPHVVLCSKVRSKRVEVARPHNTEVAHPCPRELVTRVGHLVAVWDLVLVGRVG